MAPGIGDLFNGFGDSMSWRNLLLGHAAAYKVYKNSFKDRQKGMACPGFDTCLKFGINVYLSTVVMNPLTENPSNYVSVQTMIK